MEEPAPPAGQPAQSMPPGPWRLATGGGGDGAVQVGQTAGGGMHAHRHREAEDELRGGRGRGLAPLAQRPRGAGSLRGTRRGQHLRLELQQLPHEAEVGRDDAAPLLDELKGLLQPHALLHHQVGQADGGRARDARLAVHQHTPAALLHRIDVLNGLHEPGADVGLVVVLHRDALVLVEPFEVVGAVRDVQQGGDAQGVQHVSAGSMVGAAEVEEGKDLHGTPLHREG